MVIAYWVASFDEPGDFIHETRNLTSNITWTESGAGALRRYDKKSDFVDGSSARDRWMISGEPRGGFPSFHTILVLCAAQAY